MTAPKVRTSTTPKGEITSWRFRKGDRCPFCGKRLIHSKDGEHLRCPASPLLYGIREGKVRA